MNLKLEVSARNSHALIKSPSSFNINGFPMLSLGKGTEQNRFKNVSKYSSMAIYSNGSFTNRYTFTIYKGTFEATSSENKSRYAGAFLTNDGRLEITSLQNLDNTSLSKARLKIRNEDTGGSNTWICNYMGGSNTQYFLLLQQTQNSDRFYNYDFTTQTSTAQNPINYVFVLFLSIETTRTFQVVDFKGKINDNQVKIGQPTLLGTETLDSTRKITASSYSFSTSGLSKTRERNISQNQNINQIKDYFTIGLLTIGAPNTIQTITKNLVWSSSFISYYEDRLCGSPTLTYTTYDDTTYTYELRRNNETFKAYVGQAFPNSFYNAFELVEHRHNEYIEQEDRIYYNKLSTTYISASYSRPSYNSTTVILNFTASTPTPKPSALTYSFRSGELVQISSENNFFTAPLKMAYELGDVYSYQEIIDTIFNQGTLTYSDGTTINFSDYRNDFSITISNATLEDNTIISVDTPQTFTCTININSDIFGNFTYTHTAMLKDDELTIVSAELVDYKNRFEYGEQIIFGANAKVYLKNADGDIVRTIQSSEIVNNLSVLDVNYNKVINTENSEFLNDNEFELESTLKDYNLNIVQKFKVSYPANATFNYSKVARTQYWLLENISTFKFDLSDIEVIVPYHDNTGAETEITNHSVNTLDTSYATLTNTNTKEYQIKVSFTYEGRYYEDNNLRIIAEKVRPVAIEINTTTEEDNSAHYYDTGETFKYPEGYVFTLKYNAIKSDENLNYAQVRYFWKNNELQVGVSVLSQYDNVGNANPTSITVRYTHTDNTIVESYYPIYWRDNVITSVDIYSEETISLTLGNSLNTLRGLFPIRITYADLSVVDNYQDFSFVNGDTILKSEPDSIKVYVYEDGERKEFTLTKSKYTFTKPKISQIEVNLNNLTTTINNTIDGIDLTGISLNVYYENAEYVAKISTYKYLETSEQLSANEFTAKNSTLGDNFHYDGTSIANISLSESEVEKTLPITLSIINEFGYVGEDLLTTTINVKVIEITDITGLSIERTFEDYYIGDKFLDDSIETNENCTQIWVWYKDRSGSQKRLLVNLKEGLKSLNVMPRANTQFYSSERNKIIRVSASTNPSVYVEYSINVEPKYVQSDTTKTTDLVAVYNSENYTTPKGKIISGKYLLVNENDTQVINGVRSLRTNLTFASVKVYGYLEDIGDRTKNARVILFEDYIPPIDGQSNIVCEFPCYVKGNADKINKCTFGHLFGNNNAKNRLFVSGNPDTPNCDWHSGAVNTSKQEGDVANENGDFTYFEDTSYCFYGQTDNKVVGYDIVSNDRLVVLKSKSDKEPTIYYRTSGLVQAVNGSGNNVVGLNNTALYEEQYPLSIGNIGTGALNNRAIINFNGDTLFMSCDKELDGLDITGIIGDSQRYAYSRSKYIDPIFKDIDLSKVWLWTNQKYLFVITENEIFITYFETFNTETKQYEWWKLDLKDVQTCIEYNDRIYFGNSIGELFVMDNGIYADITKLFVREGMTSLATINETNDTITLAQSIINQLEENANYTFKITPRYDGEGKIVYSSCLFYQVAYINNVLTGDVDLYVNSEENALEIVALRNGEFNANAYAEIVNLIDENINYFLNYTNGSNLIDAESGSIFNNFYQPYRLKALSTGNGLLYAVYNAETNERLNVSELRRANLVACLDKEYQIVDINKEDSTFKLIDQNEKPVNIVRYGDQPLLNTIGGEIAKYDNVKAFYISAPFTLGDLIYNKTIWAWTLTNDTPLESAVETYEATNDLDFESMRKVVALNLTQSYNLNKFNFNRVNFGKNVVPYKYTFIRPLLVPFICFGFKNNDNTNAVLCAIQINYSKPNLSFGKGR